jgi:hypothetical protein
MNTVINHLHALKPPNTTWQKMNVSSSLIGAAVGRKQDYLFVTNNRLPDYRMFIRAEDFGSQLEVSWLLSVDPLLPKRIYAKLITGSAIGTAHGLSFFKEQAIKGYASVVKQAVTNTATQLMEELKQDARKLNTRSGLDNW